MKVCTLLLALMGIVPLIQAQKRIYLPTTVALEYIGSRCVTKKHLPEQRVPANTKFIRFEVAKDLHNPSASLKDNRLWYSNYEEQGDVMLYRAKGAALTRATLKINGRPGHYYTIIQGACKSMIDSEVKSMGDSLVVHSRLYGCCSVHEEMR